MASQLKLSPARSQKEAVERSRLLKLAVNEAAGEKTPEAYPLGYVEDFSRRERSWVSFPEIPEAAQNFRQQGRRKRDD
jgi:hypothetical protein